MGPAEQKYSLKRQTQGEEAKNIPCGGEEKSQDKKYILLIVRISQHKAVRTAKNKKATES